MRKKLKVIAVVIIVFAVICGAAVFGINFYVKASTEDNIMSVEKLAEMAEESGSGDTSVGQTETQTQESGSGDSSAGQAETRTQESETLSKGGGFDCILVLGCGVRDDGSPSPMLKDRVLTAVELYKAEAAPKLLMSGDHGRDDYDEVNVMKQLAMEEGVPSEDIFMDHAGFSTYESMYRAAEIFEVKRTVVVTQKYHLYRALYDAEKLGISAYGCVADKRSYAGQSMRELREIAARDKDVLQSLLKPEPEYLGETIPVSGDGNVTNG